MWGRQLLAATGAGAALLLVVPVWTQMRTDYLASINPSLALQLNPDHVDALRQTASLALQGEDYPAAEAAALRILSLRPLENQPYRILAAVYEATDRPSLALAAHQAAVTMSPRSAPSRLWLASRELERGQFDAAILHMNWAMRTSPGERQAVFSTLMAGLAIPDFRAKLMDTLRAAPPWREDFVIFLAQRSTDLETALAVPLELAADGALAAGERGAWLQRLESERRWDAYRLLDPAQGVALLQASEAPLLVDGEFEKRAAGMGSGWRINRVAGATITLSGNSGRAGGGRALTIEFTRQRVPFDHVRQLLKLPVGRYRIDGQVRLDDLRVARGLQWSVACEQGGQTLGASEDFAGHQAWRPWGFDFEVPSGCDAQWLALRLNAQGPSETLISGMARFDALSLGSCAADCLSGTSAD